MFEGVLQLLGSSRAAFLPILPGNDAAPCVTRNCKETHVRAGRQPRMHKGAPDLILYPAGRQEEVCVLVQSSDGSRGHRAGAQPWAPPACPQPCPCCVWGEQSPPLSQPVALQPRCPQAQGTAGRGHWGVTGCHWVSLGVTPSYQPCLGQAQVAPPQQVWWQVTNDSLPEEAQKGTWCSIKKLQLEGMSVAFPKGLSVTSARFHGQECLWQLHKSEITGDIYYRAEG